MVEIVSAQQMKQIEENTAALGISQGILMDNAGRAVFNLILSRIGLASRRMVFLCGVGNNGGDALVAAGYAADAGATVTVVMAEGYPKSSLAKERLEKVKTAGVRVLSAQFNDSEIDEELLCVDIIVDGVYGTGYKGELKPAIKKLFSKVNCAIAAVFSIDIPSGVECDTGIYDDNCIIADFTLVLDSTKPCHILPKTQEKCGNIDVIDIGIPEKARIGNYCRATVITEQVAKNHLSKRSDNGNKFTFGRVVNIAGCARYIGAAALSCMGALWSGAGYVSLMSTKRVCELTSCNIPEITHIHINMTEDGYMDFSTINEGDALGNKTEVVLIGCGIGNAKSGAELVEWLITNRKKPVVIDADGLNVLCGKAGVLKKAACPIIITPHNGEMARLLGCSVEEVENNRFNLANCLAKEAGITVVLKGSNTIIAMPDGTMFINTTGNSGLSKAGSGDVLAGMIAGILAQNNSIKAAAILGVYIHGLAGENTSKRLSPYTMQPSDLKQYIGEVFLSLTE